MTKKGRSVVWEEGPLGQVEPKWTSQPSVDDIVSVVRQTIGTNEALEIRFVAQGAFNKIYRIKVGATDSNYVIRVAPSVHQQAKVESEVATMKLLLVVLEEQTTCIKVPNVIASDSSNHNTLGYERTLMQFIKGQVLETAWKTMTWQNKEELVRRVARSLAQLFKHRFRGIGNVYFSKGDSSSSFGNITTRGRPNPDLHPSCYEPREVVSMAYSWLNRGGWKPRHALCKSYAEWLRAFVGLQVYGCRGKIRLLSFGTSNTKQTSLKADAVLDQDHAEGLESSADALPPLSSQAEKMIEYAKSVISLGEKLIKSIPVFFPNTSTAETEVTFLHHGAMNWECISTIPLWEACQYPDFLRGQPRDEEPQHDKYFWPEPEQVVSGQISGQVLYEKHMLEFEQTKLRPIFEEEITKSVPEWSEVRQQSVRQVDFALACEWCDGLSTHRRVSVWLERTLAGETEYQRLEEVNIFEED